MMILIPVQSKKDYYHLLSSDEKLNAYLICLCCNSCIFITWSSYTRKSLPKEQIIIIQRMLCANCKVTHALIPAFLLGKGRYTIETISPYVEQFVAQQTTISQIYQQPTYRQAPKEISTLYRWFKRLTDKCKQLLPQLQQEIKKNSPQSKLNKLIKATDAASNNNQIQDLFHLAEQFIKRSPQCDYKGNLLSPLIFLNYFCWQKTKHPLLGVVKFSPG